MNVIWLAEIKWDYLRTRKQQLIQRRPRGVDVVYLEPYVRGRSNPSRLRDVSGVRVATIPFLKSVPAGPLRALLELPAARRVVDGSALRRARARLRDAGVDPAESTCVVSNVFAVHVAAALGPRVLVYDCNDAHADFPGLPGWARRYQDETLRRADMVIASSRGLLPMIEQARGSLDGVHQVGNGVDFKLFHDGAPEPSAIPSGVVRVGYVGAIAPWFDFELVEAMVASHPAWQFVIAGPVLAGARAGLASLARHANVAVGGAVAHEEVPALLRRFTVGMIPFRRTALTAGVNPNKLYEYLAAGLPTVATPFSADVAAVPGVIALAEDADSFAAACAELTDGRRDPRRTRAVDERAAEIARAHDWDTIAASFWSHMSRASSR